MSDTIQLKSEYEGAEVFSSEPLVAVRNNVISPIECAYLIELAKPHIKRAGVVLDEGFKPSEGRTGSNHWLKYDEDDVVKSIGQRIADIVGLPLENAESMQIIHYGPEQEYRPHFDAFNLSLARGQKAAQWGGQRLVTALVYLNKVESGGATQFPKLGITVSACPGRMVIFHNTTEDISGPHPRVGTTDVFRSVMKDHHATGTGRHGNSQLRKLRRTTTLDFIEVYQGGDQTLPTPLSRFLSASEREVEGVEMRPVFLLWTIVDDLHRFGVFEWQADNIGNSLPNRFDHIVLVVLEPMVGAGSTLTGFETLVQYHARTFDMRFGKFDQVGALNGRDNVIANSYKRFAREDLSSLVFAF